MARTLVCWNCGADLEDIPRPISRHANCPDCYEVLHCCRMCRHYAPSRPGDCDHDRADPPVHKEGANFCDYYKPKFGAFEEEEGKRKSEAKSQFDALFGEDSGDAGEEDDSREGDRKSSPDDEIRSKLDDLFRDD